MTDELPGASPVDQLVRPASEASTLVGRLRQERRPTAWTRGVDTDYPTAWEPNLLCHEAAAEIERLRAAVNGYLLAHDAAFAECVEQLIAAGVMSIPVSPVAAKGWDALAELRAACGPNVGTNRHCPATED